MEIIRDLLIFIAVMFALCIVLLVVISKMPDDNPLKRLLTALSYRIGATLAAGAAVLRVPARGRHSAGEQDRPPGALDVRPLPHRLFACRKGCELQGAR